MGEKTAVRRREKWVDDVKVIACILVVLGHFFQSMIRGIFCQKMICISGLIQQFITSMCRCSLYVVDTCIRSTAR